MSLTNVMQLCAAITFVKNELKTLADRLRSAREDTGMSQPDLAAKAKVSPGTIGNLESGARKQPRQLLAIAAALDVNPQWLLTGKGPRKVLVAGTALAVNEPPVRYETTLLTTDELLEQFGMLLATIPTDTRAALGDVLRGWAESGGADSRKAVLAGLLQENNKRRPAGR